MSSGENKLDNKNNSKNLQNDEDFDENDIELDKYIYYSIEEKTSVSSMYSLFVENYYDKANKIDAFFPFFVLRENFEKYITGNNKILWIVPGDGAYPKCGFITSLFDNNLVLSIDPDMKIANDCGLTKNLKVFDSCAENIDYNKFCDETFLIIIIHQRSHSPLNVLWNKFCKTNKLIAYVQPCDCYCHNSELYTLSNDKRECINGLIPYLDKKGSSFKVYKNF